MAKKLHKSLRIYFSKLKKIRTMSLPNPPSTSSLLSACKYPKTPSFASADRDRDRNGNRNGDREPETHAATLSDVDRFLSENFRSLYVRDDDFRDDDFTEPSDRFFVSPRTSDVGTTSSSSSTNPAVAAAESVAVVTLSRDPYGDFRRSMQEMVDERHVDPRQPLDWDFMEELLFCYLELNDRAVHKHILRAFADLAVSFRRRIPPERRKVPATVTARKKKPVEE